MGGRMGGRWCLKGVWGNGGRLEVGEVGKRGRLE